MLQIQQRILNSQTREETEAKMGSVEWDLKENVTLPFFCLFIAYGAIIPITRAVTRNEASFHHHRWSISPFQIQDPSNDPDATSWKHETMRWSNEPNTSSKNATMIIATNRLSLHLFVGWTRGDTRRNVCPIKGHINLPANFSSSSTAQDNWHA
jgi:hypothetical protein